MNSPNSSDSTPLSLLRRRSRVSSLPNPTLGNGDLVWAKSFPYVWHPAKIRRCRRSKALLSFFSSSSSPPRWTHQSRILPFEEGFGSMIGVSRGKVSEEVGLAMAEVGRRNVVGLGWGKGLGVFKREVGRVREGFEVGEVVRVVRERGVCVFGGGDEERCLAVRVAAQVLAFRRFLEDLRVGMVRCREVLGFVRCMGVGEGCGDGVGEMVEWVVAFRRFVSVVPVWVFREMAGLSGDLVDDEDEEEGSDVDSESSEESSSDEKSLVDLSNVNQTILEKPTATALEKNLDKEDEVVRNEPSGFSTQSVASSVESFASSADKCFTYKEYSSNYVEQILKLLCSTATKPSFAEAKQLEMMNEYIVKWRKLAYQDTIFSSHNNTCNRKVQPSQRFSNLTLKKVISKTDVSQSFQLNMVKDGPITEAVPASRSHLSKTFDLDAPCTSKFTKNRLHESICILSTEELLVDESPLVTVLEEKEGQCSATNVRGKDKVIDSYAVPTNSSKEFFAKVSPTQTEFVFPILGHRAVDIQDILKQLHFIAANSCCFREKRDKLVYVHLLKFRELLYLNISHLELLSYFCSGSGHQRRTRNRQVVSEHKQSSHTNGDISTSHEDDGVGRNKHVIGKPSSDSHKDNLCADDMSIFFRNLLRNSGCDQVSYSKPAFVLHVNNHITCDSEPTWTNRRSIVTREESLFIHKMLSHLYSLAVDIYHGGIWNVDLLYRILLQYRTLVLQNVQKIMPRCVLSKESEPPELEDSDVETVEMDIEADSGNAPSRDSETPLVHNVLAEISTHGMITCRTPLLSIANEKNIAVNVDTNLHGDDGKLSPDFENFFENNGVLNDNNVSVDGDITSYTNDTRMRTDLRNQPENIDVEMVETDIEADGHGSNGPKREMLAPVVLHISSEISIHDKVKTKPPSLSIVNGKNIVIDGDRSSYADYEKLSSDLRYPSENNGVLRDENIIVDGVETSHADDGMLSLDLTNLSETNGGLLGKRKHGECIQVNSCKMLNTDPCNSFDSLVSGSRNSSDLDTSFPVHVLVLEKKPFLANDIGETERGKAQFQDSISISSKQSALQKQQSEISSKRPSPCSTVQVSLKGRENGLSRSLCMKFPKGVTIPNRAELEKIFGMFGLLDQSKTQIFFYTGVAKVVFSHSVDAQTAYRFASRKKTFLHADMRYWFDDNISHGETSRVQLPSVTTTQCGMNIKSCLKRPNSNKNEIRKRKRQVRFLFNDDPASCATLKQVEPDISEPMLQLLVKCDNLVDGVNKSLGLQNYYSIFLLSNSQIQA